jgi:DNA-binding winged helix-turn-helix (wHTH) protein/tetratricopeptide (TPR) repeat protein
MPDPQVPVTPLRVRFGEFEIDEANALLRRRDSPVTLAPTPFGLLCALLRQPGSLLTKHTLLDQVWGHRFVSDSVLKGAISDVRSVLGDDAHTPRYIETVPRRGYRFIAKPMALDEATVPIGGTAAATQETPTSPDNLDVEAAPGPPLIGRAAELTQLRTSWNRVLSGSRAIVWVAGEPGIGKTTLVEHFASGLGAVTCIRGQCVQHHGPAEPYLPVLEALAELCRRDPEATALLRAIAPTWLLQMPWLSTAEQRDALLRELVGAHPQRMLREMGEFLDRYAERRPLLVITEDLHWADHSTVQLIDHVARRRGGSRLMWLASFRLTEIIAFNHPLSALRHELRSHDLCDEVLLDSFSETDVAAYVAQQDAPMAADERFVRALHQRTEGVPLFVVAVAAEVIDRVMRGDSRDAVQLASTAVPERSGALIDHYVASLGSERHALLTAAAVGGMEISIDTLSRVVGRDAVWIAEACEALALEGLWLVSAERIGDDDATERSYTFRHALFRQRLYDRATPPLRADLHRKVGAALERRRAEGAVVAPAALAMHFDLGRSPMAALQYYAEAAQAALLRLSPTEALDLTRRALALAEHLPDDPGRRALQVTLATLRGAAAFHALGAGDEAMNAYLQARLALADAPRHPMAGLALYGLGYLFVLRAEYPEALAIAESAQSLAGAGSDPLLPLAARAVRGHALMMQGHPAAALDALEAAVTELDTATADHFPVGSIIDPRVTLLAMSSLPLAHLGRVDRARERLASAYARATQLSQPMATVATAWFDALCAIRCSDTALVGTLASQMQSLVEQFDLTQGRAACQWFQGWADARSGAPLAGFRRIRAAYDDNRALGMIAGSSETLGYAAEALCLEGDLDGAREQLNQALDVVNDYGERIYLPQLLLIQASIERAQGNAPAAEASVRRAAAEARAQGACWLELWALTELAESAAPTPRERRALAALVDRIGAGGHPVLLERARSRVRSPRSD